MTFSTFSWISVKFHGRFSPRSLWPHRQKHIRRPWWKPSSVRLTGDRCDRPRMTWNENGWKNQVELWNMYSPKETSSRLYITMQIYVCFFPHLCVWVQLYLISRWAQDIPIHTNEMQSYVDNNASVFPSILSLGTVRVWVGIASCPAWDMMTSDCKANKTNNKFRRVLPHPREGGSKIYRDPCRSLWKREIYIIMSLSSVLLTLVPPLISLKKARHFLVAQI